MRSVAGVVVVLLLAVCVGYVFVTLFAVSNALPGEVRETLARAICADTSASSTTSDSPSGGMDLMIVCGPPTGTAVGMQIVAGLLLLGGLPMAGLAFVLTRYARARQRTWPADWASAFLGGFVFQASSLALTALLLFGVLTLSLDSPSRGLSESVFLALLLLSVVTSAFALRWWRSLRFSVSSQPLVKVVP
jgi:hypothetical protein